MKRLVIIGVSVGSFYKSTSAATVNWLAKADRNQSNNPNIDLYPDVLSKTITRLSYGTISLSGL